MRNKLASRKFWITVAAFLGSIATSIAGLAINEKWVTIVGMICGVLSAAIYAACEAYVDGKYADIFNINDVIIDKEDKEDNENA